MKLLLTGSFRYTDEQMKALKDIGYSVSYIEREDKNINNEMYQVDCVVCNWLFVHHDIRKFKNLKYVQLLSAGLDRIPINYMNTNGIEVHNAHGVYSIPLAEFAVFGVLQIYKNSRKNIERQKSKSWLKDRGLLELYGKRVLILGAGSVGCETAKRFRAFTNEVYGIDILPKELPEFVKIYPISMLDAEIYKSDIVIITLPLTEETKNLINRDRILRLKKGSVLINIARGSIVDETALCEALKKNLRGAAFDVFENEPLSKDSDLWMCENLVISPHIAFVSDGNAERMWNCIYNNLKAYATR